MSFEAHTDFILAEWTMLSGLSYILMQTGNCTLFEFANVKVSIFNHSTCMLSQGQCDSVSWRSSSPVARKTKSLLCWIFMLCKPIYAQNTVS